MDILHTLLGRLGGVDLKSKTSGEKTALLCGKNCQNSRDIFQHFISGLHH